MSMMSKLILLEFIRAAYGSTKLCTDVRQFPWGNDSPQPGKHGNFGFFSFAPTPVGYFEMSKSAFGVYELVGNGWEWTSYVLVTIQNADLV
jgi:formylglycine-generating enzyme required for sulfatase activity